MLRCRDIVELLDGYLVPPLLVEHGQEGIERHLRARAPRPQAVVCRVRGDAVEPGRERGFVLERADLLHEGHQHVLRDFLGVPLIGEQPAGDTVDPRAVPLHEQLDRTRLPAGEPPDQLLVARSEPCHPTRSTDERARGFPDYEQTARRRLPSVLTEFSRTRLNRRLPGKRTSRERPEPRSTRASPYFRAFAEADDRFDNFHRAFRLSLEEFEGQALESLAHRHPGRDPTGITASRARDVSGEFPVIEGADPCQE